MSGSSTRTPTPTWAEQQHELHQQMQLYRRLRAGPLHPPPCVDLSQAAILCFGLVHQGPHAGKSLVFIMPKTSALPTGESTRVHGWWAVQAADSSSRDRRSYEIVEWREVADTVTRRAGFEDTAVWEYADSEFSSFLSMCGGEQQFWREHEAGRRPRLPFHDIGSTAAANRM